MKSSLVAVLSTSTALALSSVAACNTTEQTDDGAGGGGAGTGGVSPGGSSSGGRTLGGNGGEGGAPARNVTLTFRGQVGEKAFACGDEYAAQGSANTTVTAQDFRFYVANVRLVNTEGDEVPVALAERAPFQIPELALLDFEDGSEGCADGNSALNDKITGSVPEGDYVGVVFSLSVPEELNHENPALAPAPLQAGGLSWGWLMGYRFFVGELAEVEGMGVGIFHLGSTGCDNSNGEGGAGGAGPDYGSPPTVACANANRPEIRLDKFDLDKDVIVADLGAAFAGLDLSGMAMCHGMGATCDTLYSTVGLGESGQTVFRAEAK